MIRYKCTLMYDGTNYNGFQSQINGTSIQDEVEKVLAKICDQPIKIVASGRTDAKVHAYGHVFHFDISPFVFTGLSYKKTSLKLIKEKRKFPAHFRELLESFSDILKVKIISKKRNIQE